MKERSELVTRLHRLLWEHPEGLTLADLSIALGISRSEIEAILVSEIANSLVRNDFNPESGQDLFFTSLKRAPISAEASPQSVSTSESHTSGRELTRAAPTLSRMQLLAAVAGIIAAVLSVAKLTGHLGPAEVVVVDGRAASVKPVSSSTPAAQPMGVESGSALTRPPEVLESIAIVHSPTSAVEERIQAELAGHRRSQWRKELDSLSLRLGEMEKELVASGCKDTWTSETLCYVGGRLQTRHAHASEVAELSLRAARIEEALAASE